jgi:hypothetical protein
MKALVSDRAKLRAAVQKAVAASSLPGQVSMDQANGWMAEIANLFSGVDRGDVEVALCVWGILHGVGGEDDFATKPPVVAGGKTVAATAVFGKIVPVGVEGKARQFMSTFFESMVPAVLEADPGLQDALAPRCAKAGLSRGQAAQVVDFVRGVQPETAGLNVDRQRAKAVLIAAKNRGGRSPGGPVSPVVEDLGGPVVSAPHGSGW